MTYLQKIRLTGNWLINCFRASAPPSLGEDISRQERTNAARAHTFPALNY
jgi:hypothetical protein